MYHLYAKRLLLSTFFISIGTVALSQTSEQGGSNPRSNRENSPYSRYGLGDLRNGVNTNLKAMGGASSAFTNPFAINSDNPATYTSLRLTTYEAAGEATTKTISATNQQYSTGSATLSYLAVGIPIGKHAALSFGLRPNSRVFYRFNDTSDQPGLGKSVTSIFGDGSTSYGYIGAAGKFKGLSIGFNFGYMFGTITNGSDLFYIGSTDSIQPRNSNFSRSTRIGGVYWKGGALYEAKLNDKLTLGAGGTFTMSQELNAKRDEYAIAYRIIDGYYSSDTAKAVKDAKGKMTLPMGFSGGVRLSGTDKWSVMLDYTASQWSQFRNYGIADSVADAYRASIGAEYTPNPSALRNYVQRITYRIGFAYGKDHVSLRGTDMNYFSGTIGASFPFKRSTDRLHTAFEVGQRGTQSNGLLRENFVRFTLGISLNDRWFIKSVQYD